MNYNSEFINNLIEREIEISNALADKYHYPDNITHLLYVIFPAFILKYGLRYQNLLEKCFLSIPIMIDDKKDQIYQAYYFSKPTFENGTYTTMKGIVLNNYQNIGLMQLLDNLVHEYNHAVNSLQNEILVEENIKTHIGLMYQFFDKKTLSFIGKSEGEILEEVINTKQTEMIIQIIREFTRYDIKNTVVQNTLYAIYHAVDLNYRSNSYLLESIVCQKLMQNKTFFSTIERLRFEGKLSDIGDFFDTITGRKDSFIQLSKYLEESMQLQKELIHTKWFRKNKIDKIQSINRKALEIIQVFDNNTIYK